MLLKCGDGCDEGIFLLKIEGDDDDAGAFDVDLSATLGGESSTGEGEGGVAVQGAGTTLGDGTVIGEEVFVVDVLTGALLLSMGE